MRFDIPLSLKQEGSNMSQNVEREFSMVVQKQSKTPYGYLQYLWDACGVCSLVEREFNSLVYNTHHPLIVMERY